MDDEDIRKRVRERLASAKLPREIHVVAKPLKSGETPRNAMMVGSALSDPCAVCDAGGTQLRYDMPTGAVAFHDRCHRIWQEEAAKPVRRS